MRIIICELKKIWNPVILLLIALFSLVCFNSIDFHFSFTMANRNGKTDGYQGYLLAKDMVERFGDTLEQEEAELLAKELNEIYIDAIGFIPEAMLIHDNAYETVSWTRSDGGNREITLLDEIYALETVLYNYNTEGKEGFNTNIFPPQIIQEFFLPVLVVIIMLGMGSFFLTGFMLMRDKMEGVEEVQYTCRCGRNIWWFQLIALLITAAVFTAIIILITNIIYMRYDWGLFLGKTLNSFLSPFVFRENTTMGGLIGIFIFRAFIFSSSVVLLTAFLAKHSSSTVALILKAIPVIFITGFLELAYQMTMRKAIDGPLDLAIIFIIQIIPFIIFLLGLMLCSVHGISGSLRGKRLLSNIDNF